MHLITQTENSVSKMYFFLFRKTIIEEIKIINLTCVVGISIFILFGRSNVEVDEKGAKYNKHLRNTLAFYLRILIARCQAYAVSC